MLTIYYRQLKVHKMQRLVTSLLALAALPLCISAPVQPSRWFYPCHGSEEAIEISGDIPDTIVVADPSRLETMFHGLSQRSTLLKRKVRDLKTHYVKERFRDDDIVEDFEQMGIKVHGMPSTEDATIESTVAEIKIAPTLHRAYEHLARVAVFIEQAKVGEQLAINERTSFETHFEKLEDDHDTGLYWLLCMLQQVLHHSNQQLPVDVNNRVLKMKLSQVDKNAMRHTRDYLVLRDFEKILERLEIEFIALRNHHQKIAGNT